MLPATDTSALGRHRATGVALRGFQENLLRALKWCAGIDPPATAPSDFPNAHGDLAAGAGGGREWLRRAEGGSGFLQRRAAHAIDRAHRSQGHQSLPFFVMGCADRGQAMARSRPASSWSSRWTAASTSSPTAMDQHQDPGARYPRPGLALQLGQQRQRDEAWRDSLRGLPPQFGKGPRQGLPLRLLHEQRQRRFQRQPALLPTLARFTWNGSAFAPPASNC